MKNLEAKLTAWHEAKTAADHWTARERTLRAEIFQAAFPKPVYGTNKIKLPHDMALVGDFRINYKIDRAGLEAASPLIPAETLDAVINYRPEVRDGAWRKLTGEERKLFAPFITETPGTPGLEIKPANKVRW